MPAFKIHVIRASNALFTVTYPDADGQNVVHRDLTMSQAQSILDGLRSGRQNGAL